MPDKGSNVFDECAAEFDECAAEYLCPQGNSVVTVYSSEKKTLNVRRPLCLIFANFSFS